MKNYFDIEQQENLELMIKSSEEDYNLAMEILYNIEGEYEDIKHLLTLCLEISSPKFFQFFINKTNTPNEFL